MKIKTNVTFKEYVKLIYSLIYGKLILKLLVTVAILIALWIILHYTKLLNLPKPIIYQYITLGLIAIVQPVAIYITIRRNYYSSNYLRETLETEIDNDEIKIQGKTFYMVLKWNHIFKVVEKPNWFLIYQNNLSAIIIPKCDLQEEDINYLQNILKNLTNISVELLEE